MLDILMVVLLVILSPIVLIAGVFSLAIVIGVIKALVPKSKKQKEKEKAEFFKSSREILEKYNAKDKKI